MEAIVKAIDNELNVEVLLSSVLMLRLLGEKLDIEDIGSNILLWIFVNRMSWIRPVVG